MQRLVVVGIAAAVVGLAGCTTVTSGTPMADPDQTGITTTTTRPTPTALPSTPLFPPGLPELPELPELPGLPGGGGGPATPPPNGMATTCREYADMDDATKRGMIEVLGENGYPGMKRNPLLWVTFVGAMCAIAEPNATVEQAINNKVPG